MKKILAVDDSRTLRDMLISCLKNAGHEVYSAQDGAEALERLREHRPDIVITDLNMPVMDGLDFIEAARQELKVRARRVGATGWLTKPFDETQVLSLVEQLA